MGGHPVWVRQSKLDGRFDVGGAIMGDDTAGGACRQSGGSVRPHRFSSGMSVAGFLSTVNVQPWSLAAWWREAKSESLNCAEEAFTKPKTRTTNVAFVPLQVMGDRAIQAR